VYAREGFSIEVFLSCVWNQIRRRLNLRGAWIEAGMRTEAGELPGRGAQDEYRAAQMLPKRAGTFWRLKTNSKMKYTA
jgi:hypothetical protein